ncbi:MAG: alpha/beta fold hydrolase [Phycisphaerales bacterium]|nr:alpha/beta fold hydrolase [Phycisphaerales bacterium]
MAATPRRTVLQRMTSILVILLLVWVAWIAVAWFFQGVIIFPRGMAAGRTMLGPPVGVTSWSLDIGEDKPVEAWYVPSTSEGPCPAVVILHGNGELIDDLIATAQTMAARGFHVLLPEYRGYGRSGGTPSERAIVGDAVAFVRRLQTQPDVDSNHIAFIGRSIGCGVAAGVAATEPPASMILMMPPARLDSMAWRLGVPPYVIRHPFRTDQVIGDLKMPILILARSHDEIIPASHPRRLHELAADSELIIIDGTHNAVASDEAAKRQRAAIGAFLLTHGRADESNTVRGNTPDR